MADNFQPPNLCIITTKIRAFHQFDGIPLSKNDEVKSKKDRFRSPFWGENEY